MRKITVSAPGKLMVLGEHAVVYGHPCIVTAVGQRLTLTASIDPDPNFTFEARDVDVHGHKKPMTELGNGTVEKKVAFVEHAVKNCVQKHPIDKGIEIQTTSQFSSQLGFGSSSAAAVCTIKAYNELFDLELSNKEIFELAYKTVLDVQGKGSGFDVAAAVFGGTLYFVTGGETIEPLKVASLPLIVGYSGVKADTVTLINQVSELSKRHPKVVTGIYKQIDLLVREAKMKLLDKDWQAFGEQMNINQGYLEALGVSIGKLSAMIYAAREAGAYGAKLSGAGGGDCMIAFSSEEKKQGIKDAIIKVGGEVIEVEANVEGVRVEKV